MRFVQVPFVAIPITLMLCTTMFMAPTVLAQPRIYGLHPMPKTAFERSGAPDMAITRSSLLVIPDSPSAVTSNAIAYLQRLVRQAIGDTLQVRLASNIANWQGGIIIGEPTTNPLLAKLLASVLPSNEPLPDSAGGYVLDINGPTIILAGTDANGTFNGVSTLAQLWGAANNTLTVRAAHIWDYPDYRVRALWSQHNLLVIGQVTTLAGLEDLMAAHKLNAVMQSDFKYSILDIMPSNYFTNVDSLKRHSSATNVEIIPGIDPIGYSEGVLYHDPDLAEAFPATATYVIRNDTGALVTDPATTIPNSGFENYTGQHFDQWGFYDGDGTFTTVDHTTYHSGLTSAKMTNGTGNCRFERQVACQPWHHYVLSVWVKTSDFVASYTQLLAIGTDTSGSRALTATQFSFPTTTNGWQKFQVSFNSLRFSKVNLYVGAWGGFTGTIWFDDFQIQEVGPVNIVRRNGAPMWVRGRASARVYQEGVDLDSVIDRVMEANHGNYPIDHAAPIIHRLDLGHLHNGDTIDISYAHQLSTLSDQNGVGQAMVCMSEDTLYRLLKDQTDRVERLFHPKRFFMQHDEIRVIGWDSSCLSRNLSPADILTDNATKCAELVHAADSNAEVMVWSDMFDSLHNAVNGYYLVNGGLTGDWRGLSNKITVVNWNGGNAAPSLKFFSGYGFSQITSPYYDAGNTIGMRNWRKAQEGVARVKGMMYTTWQNDYSFLTQFADYAWGVAPYIIHTPLDSGVLLALHGSPGPVSVHAEILPDGYDPNDRIVSATIDFIPPHGPIHLIPMVHDTGNSWIGTLNVGGSFQYRIGAIDSNGIQRYTPLYTVTLMASSVSDATIASELQLEAFPDPANNAVSIVPNARGAWEIEVVDMLGRTLLSKRGSIRTPGSTIMLDTHSLPVGAYRLLFTSGSGTATTALSIIR